MPLPKDRTGKRFGRLLCIQPKGREPKSRSTLWECICDCGSVVIIRSDSLVHGNTKSCGCMQKEKARELVLKRNYKHGLVGTRIYRIWHHMKERCLDQSCKDFVNYGGRGINICTEWKNDFNQFYIWSMQNGYSDILTIDRMNNDGDYTPSNCRWATRTEQNRNKRNSLNKPVYVAKRESICTR